MESDTLCLLVKIEIVVSGGMSMPQILSTLDSTTIQVDRTGASKSWKWTETCILIPLYLGHQLCGLFQLVFMSLWSGRFWWHRMRSMQRRMLFIWSEGLYVELAYLLEEQSFHLHPCMFSCTNNQGIWIENLGLCTPVWDTRSSYWNFSPFYHPIICYPCNYKECWFLSSWSKYGCL